MSKSNIEIRQAADQDIPAIIDLLKASLGESFLPKSERYWRWKHIDNPFGRSPVLVATEEGVIVGVRAFMRWQWKTSTQTIHAVRAVDTATHPSAQGRGIFTKLTMALIEDGRQQNFDLVFNTPNEKSMPGYLKMGWKKAGKLPLELNISHPVNMIFHGVLKQHASLPDTSDGSVDTILSDPRIAGLLGDFQKLSQDKFSTDFTPQYLRWRYTTIPVAAYYAAKIERGNDLRTVLIYRLKATRWGVEFRVADAFYRHPEERKPLRRLISEEARRQKAAFISRSGADGLSILPGLLTKNVAIIGPMVTVRDILPDRAAQLMNFENWSPSLGDMELF